MIYEVQIDTGAWQDIEDAALWYDLKSKGLGKRFLNSVLSTIEYIQIFPSAFPLIGREQRQALVKIFPFVIVYGISNDTIVINAVFNINRNPDLKTR